MSWLCNDINCCTSGNNHNIDDMGKAIFFPPALVVVPCHMQKRNKHELQGLKHSFNKYYNDRRYELPSWPNHSSEVKEASEWLAHTGWLSKKMINVHNSEVLEFLLHAYIDNSHWLLNVYVHFIWAKLFLHPLHKAIQNLAILVGKPIKM